MLSGRLGASLLGIIVAQKRAKRREANIKRFRIIREMINLSQQVKEKLYQGRVFNSALPFHQFFEPRLKSVYSRNCLSNWAYVINLHEYKPNETDWITLTYFDSFGFEHIPNRV